jgi:hypothetical protein
MKKIILLLLAICCIGWYSGPILKKLGIVKTASVPQSNFILPDPEPPENKPTACMTLAEYTEQVKTDPNAYNKLLLCDPQQERTKFDKLMNLFSHAKYE